MYRSSAGGFNFGTGMISTRPRRESKRPVASKAVMEAPPVEKPRVVEPVMHTRHYDDPPPVPAYRTYNLAELRLPERRLPLRSPVEPPPGPKPFFLVRRAPSWCKHCETGHRHN